MVPEADDAVKIMTIHKSKGLEFPVVIYPFANSKMQDTRKDNLWIDLEDEDIPVAYVSASKKNDGLEPERFGSLPGIVASK